MFTPRLLLDFPGSSAGKEPTCSAGDPGSVAGLGRSAGEGIGYPLQYPWPRPVAQLVKNLPAMQETWVRSLAWEDPLEKGKATHSVSWPGESHGLYSPWKELDMTEGLSLPGCFWDFPSGSAGWNPPALQETQL